MAMSHGDLDGFSGDLVITDISKKMSVCQALLTYLNDPSNSIKCSDIELFLYRLLKLLTTNNFKVSQKALEIMSALVERMGGDFKPYFAIVYPTILERLGDSHDVVRKCAVNVLFKFIEHEILSQQRFVDKISGLFSHKNTNIRSEALYCLVCIIRAYGTGSLTLAKIIPHLVKLINDSNKEIRDQTFDAVLEIYVNVGERLRVDIQKKYASQIPTSRLILLLSKMDEVKVKERTEDEPDKFFPESVLNQPASNRTVVRKPTNPATGVGGVDEETFIQAFKDVPIIEIFTQNNLSDSLVSIYTVISNRETEWNKRVDALKRIRSLVIGGAVNFDEFWDYLKKIELPMIESIKDLRSQVVREACISIAYLAQELGIKFSHFTESVLPNLLLLIQSSTKVIASSGIVSIHFIIQNVHCHRLIPILYSSMSSKSKEIRRAVCEFFDLLLHLWPTSTLDKRIPLLEEALRKGVSDADGEARAAARRAFWGFKFHFPDHADSLLNSLDQSYKRILYGEMSKSNLTPNLKSTGSGTQPQRYLPTGARSKKPPESVGRPTGRVVGYLQSQPTNLLHPAFSQLEGGNNQPIGQGDKIDTVEEIQDSISGRMQVMSLQDYTSGQSSSPTQRVCLKEQMEVDNISGLEPHINDTYKEAEEIKQWGQIVEDLHAACDNIFEIENLLQILEVLHRLVCQRNVANLTQYFRKFFKSLLILLSLNEDIQTYASVVLKTLCIINEMLKKPALISLFGDVVNTKLLLIRIMRVFEYYYSCNKEIIHLTEICLSLMAASLPVETTLKMLRKYVQIMEFPVNMIAVKTIIKVIEQRRKELIKPYLSFTMDVLLVAYNDENVLTRKNAVFGIVALYKVFGEEELVPYLNQLCPSKRKLLNLYIKRQ